MASSSVGTSSLKNLNLNRKSLSRSKVKLPPPVVVKIPFSDSDGTGPRWLVGRAAAVLLATSLCLADPALAFKGGGPYGAQVTRGQDLTGKDFSGQTLIKQDFKTVRLSDTSVPCIGVPPVNLCNSILLILQGFSLSSPNKLITCSGTCNGTILPCCTIQSILRQANFKGAKLLGASFFDADLTAADLSDADLRGADFSLANLTKTNLKNANLEGALATGNTSFKGSIINGADFTDVPLRDDQKEYLCKVADGVNPTTGNSTRETLLCE